MKKHHSTPRMLLVLLLHAVKGWVAQKFCCLSFFITVVSAKKQNKKTLWLQGGYPEKPLLWDQDWKTFGIRQIFVVFMNHWTLAEKQLFQRQVTWPKVAPKQVVTALQLYADRIIYCVQGLILDVANMLMCGKKQVITNCICSKPSMTESNSSDGINTAWQ